jgi:uncharacterized protein (TIGR03067 family)
MHNPLFLIVVVSVAVADSDEAVKKEKKALAGGWTVVSAQRDGEALPEDEARKLRLVITEERITLKQGEKANQLMYRLNLSARPSEIELVPNDGPQKGKPLSGIYELNGDNLKVCFALKPDAKRPDRFSTRSDSDTMLLILKREK